MRIFFFLAILATQLNSVTAQPRVRLDAADRIDTARSPLVIVGTFKTDMKHLVLDPQKIQSIDVIKDSAAVAKFGEAGRFGTIVIYPKTGTKFLRINEILDNPKLSNDDRKLRICINKTLIQDPQLILIEESEIENVEVTKDRHWSNVEDANSGEKFINITTKSKDKTSS